MSTLLATLVRACLPVAITLCAFLHGPIDETTHTLTTTTPTAAAPTAVEEPPHEPNGPQGPHGPQTPHGPHPTEDCVPAGLLRAPSAQTADQPPPAGATPVLAGVAALTVCPARPRRRPQRRRRARTGRTALTRTSRWRI
ncbi:hypothetical protein ACWD4G_21310 [Streptomyces sp. NPDC002643]